jgi:hypothetical protein
MNSPFTANASLKAILTYTLKSWGRCTNMVDQHTSPNLDHRSSIQRTKSGGKEWETLGVSKSSPGSGFVWDSTDFLEISLRTCEYLRCYRFVFGKFSCPRFSMVLSWLPLTFYARLCIKHLRGNSFITCTFQIAAGEYNSKFCNLNVISRNYALKLEQFGEASLRCAVFGWSFRVEARLVEESDHAEQWLFRICWLSGELLPLYCDGISAASIWYRCWG